MDWKEIEPIIQEIIDGIKKECIIQNTAIRDDIFGILENRCTVIYYPLQDEKNRGFHIRKSSGCGIKVIPLHSAIVFPVFSLFCNLP